MVGTYAALVFMVLLASSMDGRHVYSRDQLIDLRPTLRNCILAADVTDKVHLLHIRRHVRGNRAGRKVGLGQRLLGLRPIPVLARAKPFVCKQNNQLIALPTGPTNLVEIPLEKAVRRCNLTTLNGTTVLNPPSLYVLNVAALTKAHAIKHISADILAYDIDIAIISETHLKKKHLDGCFEINGYALFRRDRLGRRGGGVAVYVRKQMSAKLIYRLLHVTSPISSCCGLRSNLVVVQLLSVHSTTRRNPCINLIN